MANDIFKQATDPTPFKPLFASTSDPDPDRTLNAPRDGLTSLSAQGGRTNQDRQAWQARRQADVATRAETGKSKKLKASRKRRGIETVSE